ncbi:hypothetical protein M2373_000041 [Chryseobacterium sp. JUb7]|nr:hypothetical protein [Chryseobacterium sp. JUb7]
METRNLIANLFAVDFTCLLIYSNFLLSCKRIPKDFST